MNAAVEPLDWRPLLLEAFEHEAEQLELQADLAELGGQGTAALRLRRDATRSRWSAMAIRRELEVAP